LAHTENPPKLAHSEKKTTKTGSYGKCAINFATFLTPSLKQPTYRTTSYSLGMDEGTKTEKSIVFMHTASGPS
jgi:hypothetical protein